MTQGWWHDERFWRDVGPFVYRPEVLRAGTEAADDLVEQLELESPARILDVGCGPGRLLIPLVERGFEVVGLDTCERFRQQVRARAARRTLTVDVRPTPIEAFEEPESFDAVIASFGLVGYFGDPAYDVLFVQQLWRAARPGGRVLLQTLPIHTSQGRFRHGGAPRMCVEDRRLDRDTGVMETRWVLYAAGYERVHRSAIRIYSPEDLTGLLEFCGFESVEVHSYPGEEVVTSMGVRAATAKPE